ncbi:serine protease [Bacillus suaedae]|uniref:Serine protease n=1 Tax=Halalkalibacter suaedae TaxID=2822140 RepID=A0A940WTM0_9BACI|nr:serine protease [Bacillus suaedae]MBP3950417.1 serine protease [Bacillus suaedae]
MEVAEIEKELQHLKSRIASLQSYLQQKQKECDHVFKNNQLYEQCIKCNKVSTYF